MSSSPKQRTRLEKVVVVVSDFLDGGASSTGTRKYSVWSTGEALYSGRTCIAMWQWKDTEKSSILVEKKKVSRTADQCVGILRYMALRRGIPYVDV